jgi:hypothetical protein
MNLKKFLPVENYTLTTALDVEEVRKRILENTGAKRTLKTLFRGNATNKPYEGYITGNTFKINRIISYKNSFLPIINGHIYSLSGKTYIKIEMKILTPVLIPVIIITGIFIVVSISFNGIVPNNFIFSPLFPFLFPIVWYLVVYFSFKIESNITKKILAKHLEGKEISP